MNMHLRQCWLLQATCSLMVIAVAVTTAYATPTSTEDHQKLKQAEVLASQQPLRRGSLKYGDTFTTASLSNVELLPTSSTPVRQQVGSSRQGKRFEDIAGNGVLLSTIATERHNRSAERQPQNRNQTNRSKEVNSGERQSVRSPQANRSKEATSVERQPTRSASNRSKEAANEERQSVRSNSNRSKEAVSGERQSVRTANNRSKEAISGERQATRGPASNMVENEEGTPPNRSKEFNANPSTPTLITNNENLPGDQDLKHIQSPEGIEQLPPLDTSLNTSNAVNSPPPIVPPNTPQILEESKQLLLNNNPETVNAAKNIPHEVQHTVPTNEHTALLANPSDSRVARRHNTQVASQNQLVVQQYEIPIVQKTHKPITPTVGQLQQPQQQLPIPNQSRFAIEQPATRPQRQHHSARADAMLQPNAAHRQPQLTPTRNGSQRYSQDSTLPLSRNHNKINGRRNSVEIVGVSHSSNGNRRSPLTGNSNSASHSVAGGTQQQRSGSSATNVANGPQSPPSPHIRKPSPSTTAIATTTSRPFFTLPNQYNIFSSEFWQFLNPATRANHHPTTTKPATTKRPPKKYIPPPQHQVTPKEEKVNYPKPTKPIYQPKDTTTQQPEPIKTNTLQQPVKKDDGPFRIALPTFNFLTPRKESNTATGDSDKEKRDTDDENEDLRAKFNCPRESEVRFQLFPKICKIDEDCKTWNRGEICCDIFGAKSCVTGIPKPLEETSHSPILGLIPRKCPDRPLAELWWEVQECETDMDCWPRVCCPDGRRRYCRTSQPELNTIPVPVKRSFNYLTEYLECTAPPPRIFDLHPKACTSTLDCFPNVCCQEAGLRHCRPPKKSVLTMLATVFNVDLVKRLTQNIVIK